MANEFIARKGLISLGDSQITGSLEVTDSIGVLGPISASQIQLGTATIYSGSTRTSIGVGRTPYYYAGNNAVTADAFYSYNGGSAGAPALYLGSSGGGAGRGIYAVSQGIAFSANNSTIAYIRGRTNDSSGNDTPRIGIGVDPSAHIDLSAHINSTRNLLRISGSSAATHAEAFFISSSGNTGIGTWSPNYKLEVVGDVSASTYYGDGSNLTGIAGISFNGSTANGLVTYGSATTADVESKLTFGSSILQVNATNSDGLYVRIGGGAFQAQAPYIEAGGLSSILQLGSTSTGKVLDMRGNKLAFDSDSTNTYIQTDTDTPENLEIHVDGNLELRADDEVQIFSDVDVTGDITASGDLSINGFPSVSASLAAASGGGSSAYHTWIGGRGQNTSQATFGTQWRGGMSGNALGGSFVVNADSSLLTVSSGTPSVGDTISANNYKIITTLIHPAMAFTTIDWYGHFRAYNSACDGNEQHMEIWTLDDVNDLVGFGTTTLTFRGGNQWTYDGTSATIKPIITSGSISHTGTETTAFVVVSHVPTNPASSMQFVYKFDFTVT